MTQEDHRLVALWQARKALGLPPEQRLQEDAPVSERQSERSKDSVEEKR